jgi:uncharacterized protein YjdB
MSRVRKRRLITPVTVTVTPTTASEAHPASEQFAAAVANVHGTTITFPATCVGTWTSSDPTKATISQTGLATTVAAGATNINFTTVIGNSASFSSSVQDATPAVYTVS